MTTPNTPDPEDLDIERMRRAYYRNADVMAVLSAYEAMMRERDMATAGFAALIVMANHYAPELMAELRRVAPCGKEEAAR